MPPLTVPPPLLRPAPSSSITEPYGFFTLPPGPYESTHSGVQPTTIQAGTTWRLQSDEAVVVLGCTPPTARYFAITPYVVGACARTRHRRPLGGPFH